MRHPDLRISSRVWASRLPLGMPNLRMLWSGIGSGARLGLMTVAGTVFRGINFARIDGDPGVAVEAAEETGLEALVAGDLVAVLINAQEDGVGIAVEADFAHRLMVAGLFTLAP